MAASLNVIVSSDETEALLTQLLVPSSTKPKEAALGLSRFFKDIAHGRYRGTVYVGTDDALAVRASATITCASVNAADTVTIAGVELTGDDTPEGDDQFSSGGTNAVDAASLAAVINAHPVLSTIVAATVPASSAVVTVTCLTPGIIGNYLTLVSSNGTRLAVTGSGYLASGTGGNDGAFTTYALGL